MAANPSFEDLWEQAVDKYYESSDRRMTEVKLIKSLKNPEDVQTQLEQSQKNFSLFRLRHKKFTSRIQAVVQPFMVLSSFICAALSMTPVAPASAILGAVFYVIKAADGTSEAFDWIEELFRKLEDFTARLDEYVKAGIDGRLQTNVIDILSCVLTTLAISEKTIKGGRWKEFSAALFLGENEGVKAAFDELERLFEGEQRLITALNYVRNKQMSEEMIAIRKLAQLNLDLAANTEAQVKLAQQTKHRQEVLDWISTADFAAQHSDQIARKQEGTGQWFLDDPTFDTWLHGTENSLFCPGMPGAGKTVMAATVIDHISKIHAPGSATCAYLYCDYMKSVEQTTCNLLANISRQILQTQNTIPDRLEHLFQSHKATRTKITLEDCVSALEDLFEHPLKTYLVIDALDECSKGVPRGLLAKIQALQSKGTLKVLVTARFIPEIEEVIKSTLGPSLMLEVRAGDEDVRQFFANNLPDLPYCVQNEESLQKITREGVVRHADGMFLLAQLHIQWLQGMVTKRQVLDAVEHSVQISTNSAASTRLVEAYKDAYNKAIERIKTQPVLKTKLALETLPWISYAQRELSSSELCHALAVQEGDKHLDEYSVPNIEVVLSVCAGLIIVDEKSKVVRLVHYTLQEYLLNTREQIMPDGALKIARTCLTYLSFGEFEEVLRLPKRDYRRTSRRVSNYPFMIYAVLYWAKHVLPVEGIIAGLAVDMLNSPGLAQNLVSIEFSTLFPRRHFFRRWISSRRNAELACQILEMEAPQLIARSGLTVLWRHFLASSTTTSAAYFQKERESFPTAK